MRNMILAVLLFVAVSLPLLAQGTYTQIDVPGSIATTCSAINTAGDIVGSYYIASEDDVFGWVGFWRKGGEYTTLIHNGTSTSAFGINDMGQIVGVDNGLPINGWLYDIQTKSFTPIIYPGADYTYPMSINNAGTVAGWAGVTDSFGFEWMDSTFAEIMFPGSTYTRIYGIDASGDVFGMAAARQVINFWFSEGEYRRLKFLPADYTVLGTNPSRSTLVGVVHNKASNTYAGFVYRNKISTVLQFPGGGNTYALGVNDSGRVVGYFQDTATGNSHGFIWTPHAAAASK